MAQKKKAKAKRAKSPIKAQKRKGKPRKPADQVKSTLINFKLRPQDKKAIQARANKFAEGNLSKWVLAASLSYAKKVA